MDTTSSKMSDTLVAGNTWKKCSTCKKDIPYSTKYFLCSVSTCKHPRTGLRFCSVECWDGHLGYARHRESWAEEAFSPTREEYARELAQTPKPIVQKSTEGGGVRRIIDSAPAGEMQKSAAPIVSAGGSLKNLETLVVVSKVKQLIRDQSEMNTSQCCIDALTKKVAEECLKAIESAKSVGRKTVMGRDIR